MSRRSELNISTAARALIGAPPVAPLSDRHTTTVRQ